MFQRIIQDQWVCNRPLFDQDMSEIATGYGNLLSRAADVVLKERRRWCCYCARRHCISVTCEPWRRSRKPEPLSIRRSPQFYSRPASLADMVDHTLYRVLDLFDIDFGRIHRWTREEPPGSQP